MNRFNDSDRAPYRRILRSDSLAQANKVEEDGRKYIGRFGRFDHKPGLFMLIECQQEMKLGNVAGDQEVIFTFAPAEDKGQQALNWSKIFQWSEA